VYSQTRRFPLCSQKTTLKPGWLHVGLGPKGDIAGLA